MVQLGASSATSSTLSDSRCAYSCTIVCSSSRPASRAAFTSSVQNAGSSADCPTEACVSLSGSSNTV
ncbi:hypothetical protein ACFPRL_14605 [Pseudoclavibacter helvolus]